MKCYSFTGKNMDFEVIVDEQFMDMCLDDQLDPIENKNVLSIVNDFQDGKWRYSKFRKWKNKKKIKRTGTYKTYKK